MEQTSSINLPTDFFQPPDGVLPPFLLFPCTISEPISPNYYLILKGLSHDYRIRASIHPTTGEIIFRDIIRDCIFGKVVMGCVDGTSEIAAIKIFYNEKFKLYIDSIMKRRQATINEDFRKEFCTMQFVFQSQRENLLRRRTDFHRNRAGFRDGDVIRKIDILPNPPFMAESFVDPSIILQKWRGRLRLQSSGECDIHIKVVDCGCWARDTENIYLFSVMPFMNEGDVYDFMQRRTCISPEFAELYSSELGRFRYFPIGLCRKFLRNVLTALNKIHMSGIVHLDLSFENVLFHRNHEQSSGRHSDDDDDFFSIVDFGLALKLPQLSPPGIFPKAFKTVCPAPPSITNKFATTAVELYLAGDPIDLTKCDVWSVGVMFLSTLVGKTNPLELKSLQCRVAAEDRRRGNISFYSEEFDALVRRNLWVDYLSWMYPTACGDVIDQRVVDLLQSMLAENPNERLSTEQLLQHPWLREGDESWEYDWIQDWLTMERDQEEDDFEGEDTDI